MAQSTVAIITVILSVLAGGATASEPTPGQALQPDVKRSCEPLLPILIESVPSNTPGDGISSCEVIRSQTAWTSFCAENSLVCDSYDAAFFENWTIVAVVVETVSPVLCDNAGPVPWWQVSCLTTRRRTINARVETTLAGIDCRCSMGPQIPTVLFLVNAVSRSRAASCRAWQEIHTIECLGP